VEEEQEQIKKNALNKMRKAQKLVGIIIRKKKEYMSYK